MPSPSLLPILALLAAVLLWGLSYPAMKSVLAALDPQAVMWARMAVALLVLTPVLRRVRPRFRKADAAALTVMCLLMPCAYFFFESNALRYTTAMQAGIVSSTVPLLVACGAALFLKERLTPRALAGLVLALAEDVRIFTHGHSEAAHLERSYAPVRIGNYAKVYSGAVILPGVTVGDEALVASHALVSHDVPPGMVVAGIPAKVVRERRSEGRHGADLEHIWLY